MILQEMNMNGHWNILAVVVIRVLIEEAVTTTLALIIQLLTTTMVAILTVVTVLVSNPHFINVGEY